MKTFTVAEILSFWEAAQASDVRECIATYRAELQRWCDLQADPMNAAMGFTPDPGPMPESPFGTLEHRSLGRSLDAFLEELVTRTGLGGAFFGARLVDWEGQPIAWTDLLGLTREGDWLEMLAAPDSHEEAPATFGQHVEACHALDALFPIDPRD